MGKEIDKGKLLEKYIKYVMDEEGYDFIHDGRGCNSEVEFTDKEWEELKRISKKVNQ